MVTEKGYALTGNKTETTERRMALEIRSRRFGYAVFQGADLLDWGVRSYPAGVSAGESAVRSLTFLLKLYAPSVVIARRTRRAKDVSSEQATRISKKIGAKLKRSFIPLALLNRRFVFDYFAGNGCHNKYEIATFLAARFPRLKLRLPRPRKPWEPERYVLAVFDAVATAVAFSAVQPLPNSSTSP
jgi:hypothetical protein